jgi:hypothetical protein
MKIIGNTLCEELMIHFHRESTTPSNVLTNDDQSAPEVLEFEGQCFLLRHDTLIENGEWLLPLKVCTQDTFCLSANSAVPANKDIASTIIEHSNLPNVNNIDDHGLWHHSDESNTSEEGDTSNRCSPSWFLDTREDLSESAMSLGLETAIVLPPANDHQPSNPVNESHAATRGSACERQAEPKSEYKHGRMGRPQKPKRRSPQSWASDDCKKFLKGLKHFGLTEGLGSGGAELMAFFMGNRSVLQVKSHMQKYMKDKAKGRIDLHERCCGLGVLSDTEERCGIAKAELRTGDFLAS